jgi:hypothetical protein
MTERPPEEVRIRLKHGDWEVEITCAENKIRQVVENVLTSLDMNKLVSPLIQGELEGLRREIEALKSGGTGSRISKDSDEKTAKGGMTCRGLLDSLWQEGYFANERVLAEVHEELGRRGYNYDRTAVSHSLADMVRENILTRTGTMRNFRYIQKRPLGV